MEDVKAESALTFPAMLHARIGGDNLRLRPHHLLAAKTTVATSTIPALK